MPHDVAKLLIDVNSAAKTIQLYSAGRSLAEIASNQMLRDAVERQFIVIGEALAQISKSYEHVAGRITDISKIVGFRNVLVHGYDNVDPSIV